MWLSLDSEISPSSFIWGYWKIIWQTMQRQRNEKHLEGINAIYHIFLWPWELEMDFRNVLCESCIIKASPIQQWYNSDGTNDMTWNEKLQYWLRRANLWKICIEQWFSKCGPGTHGVPETLSQGTLGRNYFHNNIRMLFALCTSFSQSIRWHFWADAWHVILYQIECRSRYETISLPLGPTWKKFAKM